MLPLALPRATRTAPEIVDHEADDHSYYDRGYCLDHSTIPVPTQITCGRAALYAFRIAVVPRRIICGSPRRTLVAAKSRTQCAKDALLRCCIPPKPIASSLSIVRRTQNRVEPMVSAQSRIGSCLQSLQKFGLASVLPNSQLQARHSLFAQQCLNHLLAVRNLGAQKCKQLLAEFRVFAQ